MTTVDMSQPRKKPAHSTCNASADEVTEPAARDARRTQDEMRARIKAALNRKGERTASSRAALVAHARNATREEERTRRRGSVRSPDAPTLALTGGRVPSHNQSRTERGLPLRAGSRTPDVEHIEANRTSRWAIRSGDAPLYRCRRGVGDRRPAAVARRTAAGVEWRARASGSEQTPSHYAAPSGTCSGLVPYR